jgi:hypothetical protein
MLGLLIGLTIVSFLVLASGAGLMLTGSGRTTRRQGQEVGREMIAEQMERQDETSLAQASAFRGKAVEVSTEASVGLGDVKRQLSQGQWRQALPALLAIGGLIGLLTFGALAIFVAIDDKLVGGLILAVVLFTVLRMAIAMARA